MYWLSAPVFIWNFLIEWSISLKKSRTSFSCCSFEAMKVNELQLEYNSFMQTLSAVCIKCIYSDQKKTSYVKGVAVWLQLFTSKKPVIPGELQ